MFVVVVLVANSRAADGDAEDPVALSIDSVPATTRYTVPAARATRSAVFF